MARDPFTYMLMSQHMRATFLAAGVLAVGFHYASADENAINSERYKNVSMPRMLTEECDGAETGKIQASCKVFKVGDLFGGYFEPDAKKDPNWSFLKKYLEGEAVVRAGDHSIKFGGLACARADTSDKAKEEAIVRATERATTAYKSFENDYLNNYAFNHVGFTDNVTYSICVEVPNTSGNAIKSPVTDLPTSGADAAKAAAAAKQEAEAEYQKAHAAVFLIQNSDRYTLGLEFTSKASGGKWPGHNQQYVLDRSSEPHRYALSCKPNEKICFGAWRDHQTTYWGIGHGHEGCTNCCITCGNQFQTNLTDGGPDSYSRPNNGSAADWLNALSAVAGAAGTIRGAQTYHPAPRRIIIPDLNTPNPGSSTYTGSDISGTQ